MAQAKRFFLRTPTDIKEIINRSCSYYKAIHHFISKGEIKSSVDRGSFVRPQDLLPEEIVNKLGVNRNSLSYAYGPEIGERELCDLRLAIENKQHGTKYQYGNIAFVPGAWAGTNLVIETIFDSWQNNFHRGSIVVIGPTHYQLLSRAINFLGIDVFGMDFVLSDPHVPKSIEELDELWHLEPRMIFITNPNNPDAIYFPASVLHELILSAQRRNCFIVIDEIQDFFPRSGSSGLDYGPWIEAENVIRIDSYSKKRALAEYRIGWVIASASVIGTRTSGLLGRLTGFVGNAPRAANTAVKALFENELSVLDSNPDLLAVGWQELSRRMIFVNQCLDEIQGIQRLRTDACLNTVVKVTPPLDDFSLSRKLMERGTLIMPCSGYGYASSSSVLRITFAERMEKLAHSLAQLKTVLSDERVLHPTVDS